MKKWIVIGIAVATALNLWAQAPEMFRYQGRLVDGTNLVNATLPMSFKLYDAQSSGNLIYEDSSSVLVVDGLYSTMIGDNTVSGSLTNALTNATVYLQLTVNGETLAPRERLVSVPYALNAPSDTTPTGAIVLSETYPNPKLEAQGYSVVTATPGQNWLFLGSLPYDSFYSEPKALSFSGKMWIFRGISVWSSNDGKLWTKTTENIGCASDGYSLAAFNGKMWCLGGRNQNDIWCSEDGSNWTLATASAEWSPRNEATVAVFDGKLWIMGGWSSSGLTNDVWCSSNGTNWTLATDSAAWTARSMAAATVFQDKLWLIGGSKDSGAPCADWWCSSDGITWSAPATNYWGFNGTTVCTLDEQMYVSSRYCPIAIIATTNGIDWQSAGVNDWSDGLHFLLAHDGFLWSMGDIIIARSDSIKQENGLYYYRKD